MSATPKTRKPHKSGGIPRAQTNPILFLTGIFFFNMLSRLGLAPLLPGIETDLAMNHSQAGGLFFLISSGYCISLFGSIFLTPLFTGGQSTRQQKIDFFPALHQIIGIGGKYFKGDGIVVTRLFKG